MAVHSPLAQKIFALPAIKCVLVGGNLLTVTAQAPLDDWRSTAKQIAVLLRDHLRSGLPAVLPSYRTAAGAGSLEAGIRGKIVETLDSQINPAIASHGGSISLVDVRGTVVFIQMAGGCQGCASSSATLQLGVENAIRNVAPEVTEIVDVTDHAAGVTPYYAKQ
jgi:Fe-S cluster biogenesis protein NfuA